MKKNLSEKIGEFVGAGIVIAIAFMVIALVFRIILWILGIGG